MRFLNFREKYFHFPGINISQLDRNNDFYEVDKTAGKVFLLP